MLQYDYSLIFRFTKYFLPYVWWPITIFYIFIDVTDPWFDIIFCNRNFYFISLILSFRLVEIFYFSFLVFLIVSFINVFYCFLSWNFNSTAVRFSLQLPNLMVATILQWSGKPSHFFLFLHSLILASHFLVLTHGILD